MVAATATKSFPPGALIEEFAIRPRVGPELRGFYHATRSRRCGRRIVVRDLAGNELFDTDDCYDQGNACASLDEWLLKYESQFSK